MAIQTDPEGFEMLALGALLPELTGRRVLEVGCGDGRLTRRLASRGASLVAIDPDADVIAAARDAQPGATIDFRVVDFVSGDPILAPASFDVVLLSWSL
jgi:2-polyprenyl-3-methyl-5-hydroxy-6-metoxy-1,4-benzoquinol methylase